MIIIGRAQAFRILTSNQTLRHTLAARNLRNFELTPNSSAKPNPAARPNSFLAIDKPLAKQTSAVEGRRSATFPRLKKKGAVRVRPACPARSGRLPLEVPRGRRPARLAPREGRGPSALFCFRPTALIRAAAARQFAFPASCRAVALSSRGWLACRACRARRAFLARPLAGGGARAGQSWFLVASAARPCPWGFGAGWAGRSAGGSGPGAS
jgi:hypothetical protein